VPTNSGGARERTRHHTLELKKLRASERKLPERVSGALSLRVRLLLRPQSALQIESGHIPKLFQSPIAQVPLLCHRLRVQQDNKCNIFGGLLRKTWTVD
jgi:hypothetical protein